jgi:hypothetical protein
LYRDFDQIVFSSVLAANTTDRIAAEVVELGYATDTSIFG